MNIILRIYYLLPSDSSFGIFSKILNRIFARVIKRILDTFVPFYFQLTNKETKFSLNKDDRKNRVIVSLTSFPGRINDVWIPIECIFRQSFKPDKIVLWLSELQFQDKENLPKELKSQVNRGLEIRLIPDDLKSHKKYLYSFNELETDFIITVDDDLYYDNKLIENLINLKSKFPEVVVTNRAHKIKIDKSQNILPYRNWSHNVTDEIPSELIVQTGGFGTLYQKSDLHDSYNNVELIKSLIPHADDLWLKIQTLLAGKKIVTNNRYNKDPITVKKSQLEKLVNLNVIDGGNDEQLKSVLLHFENYNIMDVFTH